MLATNGMKRVKRDKEGAVLASLHTGFRVLHREPLRDPYPHPTHEDLESKKGKWWPSEAVITSYRVSPHHVRDLIGYPCRIPWCPHKSTRLQDDTIGGGGHRLLQTIPGSQHYMMSLSPHRAMVLQGVYHQGLAMYQPSRMSSKVNRSDLLNLILLSITDSWDSDS